MKYKVNFIDNSGIRHEKVYSGLDKSLIINDLKNNDFKIINIEEVKDISLSLHNKKIKNKKLVILLKELSILLSSGMDTKTALEILIKQEKDKDYKLIYEEIDNNLDNGYTLSQSVDMTQKFPKLVTNIIEAGEHSSNLSESLDILSEYYKKEEKLKQNLKNSLYYPVILLLVTFIIISIVVSFIIPKYLELYKAFEITELPALTTFVINTSSFISRYSIFIILAIILIILFLKNKLSDDKKVKFSRSLLRLPFLGEFLINNDIQRFSGIFRIMLKSGIETIKAVELSSKSMKNLYLKTRFEESKNDILNGHSLNEAFSKISESPTMFLNLINIGEYSSNLESSMATSYDYFSNQVEEDGKKLMSIFEPLVIILVSIVVGTVVIAIALPTFNLVDVI